jgi:photosynthetic reaction center cytochrome c subunit
MMYTVLRLETFFRNWRNDDMKRWASRLMLVVSVGIGVWLIGGAMAGRAVAQAPAAKTQTAGEAFKAVTTSTLKGLTVSDFLGSMGVMAAALGYDCADCHVAAGTDKADWVFDTPKKKTARRMVEMVANINRTNFGGAQMVTCWTCHHGRDIPATTIALDTLYGTPNNEKSDIVSPGEGVPSAIQILDKYIAAVGGAQRLAGLKSFIATGSSVGYEGLGGGGSFQIFAQAPDKRTTQIVFKDHPERGDSTRVYDGKEGWIKSPRGLLPEYELTGSELEGAKLDAVLSFPGQIKQALTNWRVGSPDSIGDDEVDVVQGSGPKGLLASLYFDRKSGLLVRIVRYSASPIGRIPTQIDYSDYRDVNGIKFPFKYTFSWLDGRDRFQLNDVKTNVPIDPAKFGKP